MYGVVVKIENASIVKPIESPFNIWIVGWNVYTKVVFHSVLGIPNRPLNTTRSPAWYLWPTPSFVKVWTLIPPLVFLVIVSTETDACLFTFSSFIRPEYGWVPTNDKGGSWLKTNSFVFSTLDTNIVAPFKTFALPVAPCTTSSSSTRNGWRSRWARKWALLSVPVNWRRPSANSIIFDVNLISLPVIFLPQDSNLSSSSPHWLRTRSHSDVLLSTENRTPFKWLLQDKSAKLITSPIFKLFKSAASLNSTFRTLFPLFVRLAIG